MRRRHVLTAAVAALCIACSSHPRMLRTGHLLPPPAQYVVQLPAGFRPPVTPVGNPVTAGKVALGRLLFYDTRLSANGKQSCATCHQQERAFTDDRVVAEGSTGQVHFRNTMTLTNVAYRSPLTWSDPAVHSLEEQALIPLTNEHPVELGFAGKLDALVDRLRRVAEYRQRFAAEFGGSEPVTLRNVQQALASFERTLISGRSPFDRFAFQGDSDALSPGALRGMSIFFSARAGCSTCHSGSDFAGPADSYRNTGLYESGSGLRRGAVDPGLKEHTGRRRDAGRFRVPTLRNVAVTAPYMHDGSVATLSDVIDAYAAGGRARLHGAKPSKDVTLRPFRISDAEKADLIAFLSSLTDEMFLHDPSLGNPWPPEQARDSAQLDDGSSALVERHE